ncbi:hypothetical protein FRACYDRAFT_247571 [Fragilariopsis cylindrus CCMP1102]|uniref:Amino acid transporter transmembrane domain-containing protein n=1 Tax=Fragilariopsis cylindrus CCMP1102 TaxID=635003 RepID=A0A1E7EWQ2_9STRA|nr:hypothetical protein FRACYDRAFT_247571 [Fragilariopsis cylindrus CCMP1102]|eukprot:OEU09963.1 hypothetical protein FRACYDRAFT_247571 [Fragilariopsis cylindrus CCMP1102]
MTGVDETTPFVVHIGNGRINNTSTDDKNGSSARSTSFRKKFSVEGLRESAGSISKSFSEDLSRIGFLGSTAIGVNSLIGPAMLYLPDTYQRSGLIPTTAVIIFVCILSALCCLHMSNTISKVHNNKHFSLDVGYSECFQQFWGPKSYFYTQVLFFCCVTCLNVSSIVDTAQVVDTFFGHWVPHGSSAVNFQWIDNKVDVRWINWDYSVCSEELLISGECVPFFDSEGGILLTIGYVVTVLVFLPMALMDLKENAIMQVGCFVTLLVTSMGFIFLFLAQGINLDNVSLWGDEWGSLFGVVLFNFALVIAIPAALLYIVIGILGAITMPNVSQNMLEGLMSGSFGTAMQLCASIFAFVIIGLGCPLFSILVRMNLSGSGFLSMRTSNGLAVYLPFLTSWIFYQGDAVTNILSWGGIIFTSLIAFILPLLLSLHSLETGNDEGSVNVYKPWRVIPITSQRTALRILLAFASVSIIIGILGNLPFITSIMN